MNRFLALFFLLAFTSCTQTNINSDSPQKVTLCQIKKDPAAYNRQLVEVTGFISQGFEDSSIYEMDCEEKQGAFG